jgi:hypothetical protein
VHEGGASPFVVAAFIQTIAEEFASNLALFGQSPKTNVVERLDMEPAADRNNFRSRDLDVHSCFPWYKDSTDKRYSYIKSNSILVI